MDGRAQRPVYDAAASVFGVDVVDIISEPGMVKFLSDHRDSRETAASLAGVGISLERHASQGIAVAAHYDCAGNPVSEGEQKEQLARAVAYLREEFPGVPVVGLWVGADWTANVAVSAGE